MMTRDAVSHTLLILLLDHGYSEHRIKKDTRFNEDLGFDSLDWVELVIAVEDGFDIDFEEDDPREVSTFSDAVDAIMRKAPDGFDRKSDW